MHVPYTVPGTVCVKKELNINFGRITWRDQSSNF